MSKTLVETELLVGTSVFIPLSLFASFVANMLLEILKKAREFTPKTCNALKAAIVQAQQRGLLNPDVVSSESSSSSSSPLSSPSPTNSHESGPSKEDRRSNNGNNNTLS